MPAEDPDLRVTLKDGEGKGRTLPFRREGPGIFVVDAKVGKAGSYELEAEVRGGGRVYGSDSAAVEYAWPPGEFRKPGLNRRALVRLSGDARSIVPLGAPEQTSRLLGEKLLAAAPPYRVSFDEKRELGSRWWAFALLMALLTAEWTVRKRYGMD